MLLLLSFFNDQTFICFILCSLNVESAKNSNKLQNNHFKFQYSFTMPIKFPPYLSFIAHLAYVCVCVYFGSPVMSDTATFSTYLNIIGHTKKANTQKAQNWCLVRNKCRSYYNRATSTLALCVCVSFSLSKIYVSNVGMAHGFKRCAAIFQVLSFKLPKKFNIHSEYIIIFLSTLSPTRSF